MISEGADAVPQKTDNGNHAMRSTPEQTIPHISVCICTYKRPLPLKRLLGELNRQETGGAFTYSIVVADNEEAQSGKAIVAEARLTANVRLKYDVEPRRGIALARNKVVGNADGDFLAFIDDDELPSPRWLLTLLETCQEYNVDGVLGPVKRQFEEVPPEWLEKSDIFDRRIHPTGTPVDWQEARTGNVLLRKRVIEGDSAPFRPEFRSGEDGDFFRRKMEAGHTFIWSESADVFEVLPPARWKRTFFLKRALLNGSMELNLPTFGIRSILKSVIAIPLYVMILPFTLLLGQHRFMSLMVSLCCHLGKLLALAGIHIVKEAYISD